VVAVVAILNWSATEGPVVARAVLFRYKASRSMTTAKSKNSSNKTVPSAPSVISNLKIILVI
jgi:hypothetical protein